MLITNNGQFNVSNDSIHQNSKKKLIKSKPKRYTWSKCDDNNDKLVIIEMKTTIHLWFKSRCVKNNVKFCRFDLFVKLNRELNT